MQTLCFSVSGECFTRRVRHFTFKAMLRQEIGWFDDDQNTTGILVGTLADDGRNVQAVRDTITNVLVELPIKMCYIILIVAIIIIIYN